MGRDGRARARSRTRTCYCEVACLGRTLTRAGYTVSANGWRPRRHGSREPRRLDSRQAADADLDDGARSSSPPAPSYEHDPVAYVDGANGCGGDGRTAATASGYRPGCTRTNPRRFATHIAKYFTNSIREDGLLASRARPSCTRPAARAPSRRSSPTPRRTAYTLYEVRSPMVFLGRDFFEHEQPESFAAVRRQATASDGPSR